MYIMDTYNYILLYIKLKYNSSSICVKFLN